LIARKKILAFLILAIILGGIVFYLAQSAQLPQSPQLPQIETGAKAIKTEVRIIPIESSSASNGYIDSPSNLTFMNEDVSNSTISNVRFENRFEFNVTFQILNVSKGTFDNGVIINSTAIGFNASEIDYGANKTGMVWIRYYNMSIKSVLGKIWQGFWGTIETVSHFVVSVTELFSFIPEVSDWWLIAKAVNIVAKILKPLVGIPEFPIGFAFQITLIPVILYIWWKRKHRTLR